MYSFSLEKFVAAKVFRSHQISFSNFKSQCLIQQCLAFVAFNATLSTRRLDETARKRMFRVLQYERLPRYGKAISMWSLALQLEVYPKVRIHLY